MDQISNLQKQIKDVEEKVKKVTQSLQGDSSDDGDSVGDLTKQLKVARLRVRLEEAKWQMKKVTDKVKEQKKIESLKADIMSEHNRGDKVERESKRTELAAISIAEEEKIRNKLRIPALPKSTLKKNK